MPDLEQDNYSGFAMRFEFDDFDIIPSQCEVAYECTSVKYENDELPNRSMKCSDFELFGKIGGGFGTNALEITIDRDRYDNPDRPRSTDSIARYCKFLIHHPFVQARNSTSRYV